MEAIKDILREQMDKIRDVQSLLTAISELNKGDHESRLANMAERQLEVIHDALDTLTSLEPDPIIP